MSNTKTTRHSDTLCTDCGQITITLRDELEAYAIIVSLREQARRILADISPDHPDSINIALRDRAREFNTIAERIDEAVA